MEVRRALPAGGQPEPGHGGVVSIQGVGALSLELEVRQGPRADHPAHPGAIEQGSPLRAAYVGLVPRHEQALVVALPEGRRPPVDHAGVAAGAVEAEEQAAAADRG